MMSYLLNPVHYETFEKSLMKSGPTNMVLICSNYETRFIGRQSEVFKWYLRQKSHETWSIEYGLDI